MTNPTPTDTQPRTMTEVRDGWTFINIYHPDHDAIIRGLKLILSWSTPKSEGEK